LNIIADRQTEDAENNTLFDSESPHCSSKQRYSQLNRHNYYEKSGMIEESRFDSLQETKISLFLHSAQFEAGAHPGVKQQKREAYRSPSCRVVSRLRMRGVIPHPSYSFTV
jgi:hypothetical protein